MLSSVSVSVLLSSSLLSMPMKRAYFSSSLCILSSCSNNVLQWVLVLLSDLAISTAEASTSGVFATGMSAAGVSAAASGGGISVFVTSAGFSSGLFDQIVNFEKGMSSAIPSIICGSVSCLGGIKSTNDFCSFAFSPSQSSIDQAKGTGEGCQASYLQ